LEVHLPHEAPIRFVKSILSKENDKARVSVEFDERPSLAMLVEAAAQSSSALNNEKVQTAYLVSMKDIQLLITPTKNNLEIEVINQYSLENMKNISFSVFENGTIIADGSFTIAIHNQGSR